MVWGDVHICNEFVCYALAGTLQFSENKIILCPFLAISIPTVVLTANFVLIIPVD